MDDFEERYDAALQALKEAAIAKGDRDATTRVRRELLAAIDPEIRMHRIAGSSGVEVEVVLVSWLRAEVVRICPEAPGGPAASVHVIPGVGPVTVEEPTATGHQPRASSYRAALAGVVALPALMDYSLAVFGQRLANFIRHEQAKPHPDNSLIALLCDAARLGDEFVIGLERREWIEGPADEALPCGPGGHCTCCVEGGYRAGPQPGETLTCVRCGLPWAGNQALEGGAR